MNDPGLIHLYTLFALLVSSKLWSYIHIKKHSPNKSFVLREMSYPQW